MNLKQGGSAIALCMMLGFAFTGAVSPSDIPIINTQVNQNIQATSDAGSSMDFSEKMIENSMLADNVHVRLDRDGDGQWETEQTTHNALMEGEEVIKAQVSGNNAQPGNWTQLSVGDQAAPGDGDGSLAGEYSTCGLSPKYGNYEDNGDGGWNITATWDVTCDDITINTTAQLNPQAGTSYDYFAGADLGRDINAYSGDTLQVEWSNTADGTN